MKNYDVIIIGGGASGLMTALQFENSKKRVAIFEAGYTLGKKILVTGNGKCNLTNMNVNSSFYNTNIDTYLSKFSVKDTLKFFNEIGLETYADECGRVYPITNSAKSVLDVLTKRVYRLKNVDYMPNFRVDNVKQVGSGFAIYNNEEIYGARNLVICTGNIENPFIKELTNENYTLFPSLVALTTVENTKNLDGVKVSNVKITAECNGKKKSEMGELLFKDKGLSGIAIFNLSTLFARKNNFEGKVVVNLLPGKTPKQIAKIIKSRCAIYDNVIDIFTGMFVDTIREELFRRAKVNEQLKSSRLSKDKIELLSELIHGLVFNINGCYNNNQVMSGGVKLSNLNNTLEHKNIKGLYFTGEAIDVDGECGGYNLQWAWTSGAIVGRSLK